MDYFQIIVLAIIQGLTEFLPVSSSGHLILAPKILGYEDQGLGIDAILHLGTLLAILVYFRKDLTLLAISAIKPQHDEEMHQLSRNIILASFPAGIVGLFAQQWIESNLRSPQFVAGNMILWSIVFYWADQKRKKSPETIDDIRKLSFYAVLFIGIAQSVALLPGTSRSGITICAGLFCGLSGAGAARFSFLLGSPIIFAAGVYELLSLSINLHGNEYFVIGLGCIVAFLVGLGSIHLLLGVVKKFGLTPFVLYRCLLAAIILLFYI
jgi:undecaprenyl-diphosphatase